MGFMELTELLQEKLQIEYPPVALAFVSEPPRDVLVIGKEAPSFCTLWRWGEQTVFYAAAEQHLGCLIGGVVAGFPLSPTQTEEAQSLMEEMCQSDEIPPDRLEQVPKITKASSGVVYGPLWRFPLQPDLVLLWATLVQAALLQEVAGALLWRGNPQGAVFTRPACSVLALALAHEKPALSLGCVGMRVYTKIPQELCLLAVPASSLEALEEGLKTIQDPHARMQVYYDKIQAAST